MVYSVKNYRHALRLKGFQTKYLTFFMILP